MKFSADRDSSLFGLDNPTSEYLAKLEAAHAFGRIRKDLDKDKALLETFAPRQFAQRKNKDQFEENVQSLVNGDIQKFPPLLQTDTLDHTLSPKCLINRLILAFFSLKTTNLAAIQKHGLVDIFPAFFFRVVGDGSIFAETRKKFVEIIESVCHESQTETAAALSNLLQTERTEESPPSKRQRHNPPEGSVIPSDRIDASEPLIFHADDLVLPKTDVQPNLGQKNVAFQFTEARGDRLPVATAAMLQAIKVGGQWCWERQQEVLSPNALNAGEMRTNSIIAMIPDTNTQDISLILRVGYRAGRRIIDYLDFRNSQEEVFN